MLRSVALSTWSFEMLPFLAESALLPAVIGALFLSFMYIPKTHGTRLITVVLLIVFSSAALFFGLILTDELSPVHPDNDVAFPFREREIYHIRSGELFTANAFDTNSRVDGVVHLAHLSNDLIRLDIDRSTPLNITYYPRALYNSATDMLNAEGTLLPIVPEDPVVSPLVTAPPFLSGFTRNIRDICNYLSTLRRSSLDAYLTACIGLCAFAASCLFFANLSSWRFACFLITVLMFRGVFLVFELFTGDLVQNFFSGIDHELISQHLPALLFFVLSVLFLAADHLFLRRTRKI